VRTVTAETNLVPLHVVSEVDEIEAPAESVKLGDWYWLALREEPVTLNGPQLVCVTHIGTNYVEVEEIGGTSWRVHFDNFNERLTPEPSARDVWRERAATQQAIIAGIMREVNELTAGLSLRPDQTRAW
jgi:hypothetical protein